MRTVAASEKQLKLFGEENTINFECFCNAACRHWEVPAHAGSYSSSSSPEEQTLRSVPADLGAHSVKKHNTQILDPGDAMNKPNLVL